MRNARGIEIKVGYYAWGRGYSGLPFEGTIREIDKSSGLVFMRGPDGNFWQEPARIDEVLPPMRVLKGGVVKANPVTEARELWLYARNKFEFVNASRDAFQRGASAAQWKAIALKAARSYSAEFGSGAGRWRDIFTDDDLSVTASMLRDDMQNEAEDDQHYANPTPRLKKPTQKSQRMRVDPKTGEFTDKVTKSSRLYQRRLKTHHLAPPGVWANPLTRVKLKSPMQRPAGQGEIPEKGSRQYKRRQTTNRAPAGFYANPTAGNNLHVEYKTAAGSWKTVKRFPDTKLGHEQSVAFAHAYADKHPTRTVRVYWR